MDGGVAEEAGHRVFELWVEEGEDGELRQRAVRLDSVPAAISGGPMGALDGSGDYEGAQDGAVTALNGFPLDGFIPVGGIDAPDGSGDSRDDETMPPDFTVMEQDLPPATGFMHTPSAASASAPASEAGSQTGFASWSVRNGRVSAPDMKNSLSPFPFDVVGAVQVESSCPPIA